MFCAFKNLVVRTVFLLSAFLFLAGFDGEPQSLPTSCLIVDTGKSQYQFTVELADDEGERSIGMMYRREMGDDTGMLFSYPRPDRLSFWMRNTYIPLDIIFIRPSGMILNIHENAEPETLDSRASAGPAIAVLEIRGGLSEELGIQPGHRVRHSIFSNGGC